MVFSSLNTELQNILLLNYQQFGKMFLILIILGSALFYRMYWKPYRQQETIFISLGIMRMLWNPLSSVLLWASPFFFIFMSPEFGLWDFFNIFLGFITIAVTIFSVFIGLDIFKIGLLGVLSKMGVNVDPKVSKFFKNTIKKGSKW